jgi:hypothetical protein
MTQQRAYSGGPGALKGEIAKSASKTCALFGRGTVAPSSLALLD